MSSVYYDPKLMTDEEWAELYAQALSMHALRVEEDLESASGRARRQLANDAEEAWSQAFGYWQAAVRLRAQYGELGVVVGALSQGDDEDDEEDDGGNSKEDNSDNDQSEDDKLDDTVAMRPVW